MRREIVIDARKLGDGGIGVYIENLVYGLLDLPQYLSAEWKLNLLVAPELLVYRKDQPDLAKLLSDWRDRVEFIPDQSQKYSFSEYFRIAPRHKQLLSASHLYHSPHYTLPYNLPIPSVVTIHDIIHITHPDTPLHKIAGKMLVKSAIKRATHIVTVSEASANALVSVIPKAMDKLTVIPNSLRHSVKQELVEADFDGEEIDLEELGLADKNYFLFVGSDRPHKGLSTLLEAWALWRNFPREVATSSFSSPKLVAVGDFGEGVRGRAIELGVERDVIFNAQITVSEMVALQRRAAGVLIPSREEGFGLVALESMVMGVPIVAFPVPSLIEVCKESGWFADDFSAISFARTLEALRTNPGLAELKIRHGKRRSNIFNLRRFAESTQAVFESILDKSSLSSRVEIKKVANRPG